MRLLIRNLSNSKRILANVFVLLSWFASTNSFCCNPAHAAENQLCPTEGMLRISEQKYQNYFRLILDPPSVLEALIDIDMDLDNMSASSPTHFSYTVDGLKHSFRAPIELTHVTATIPGQPFHYHWNYHWKVGVAGGHPDYNFVYALPYSKGETHNVNQGYGGTFSHYAGSEQEFCLDFGMPEGNPICAARGGIVVASYGDFTFGGNDRKYEQCANQVVVKHSDGTYGRYLHLKPHGNLVRVGQLVKTGDVLGLAGQTGFADRPHLHFAVVVPITARSEKTIPTKFATPHGIVDRLQQGVAY